MKPIRIVTRRILLMSLLSVASVGSATFAASLAPTDSRDYQTADGLVAYIGIVPAEVVKEEHPAMHGGAPTRSNEYHFVVAIFDAGSGERVTDATVSAIVFGPGNTVVYGQRHLSPWGTRPLSETLPRTPLEPMAIAQTVTYGGFFVLPELAKYTFQLTIARPGKTRPTVMNFAHDHRL
jgi:hypothetical protein